MKFIHILLTFLFITTFSKVIQGQEAIEDPNIKLDKKYTPNQNSVFSSNSKHSGSAVSSGDITIKNLVKFCPTALFRQKAILYYEFDLINGLTLNAGVGKSFGEDFFQKTYLSTLLVDVNANRLSLDNVFNNSTYTSGSIFLTGGIKYYEKMDYTLNANVNSATVIGDDRVMNFKVSSFNFGYGYTMLSGPKNNFSHEFFMGCGVRFVTYSEFEMSTNFSSSYNASQTYTKTGGELKARIFPSVNMSYLFGFGF